MPVQGTGHARPRRGRGRQLVDGLPRVPPGLGLLPPPRTRDLPRAGDLGRGRLARRQRRPAGRARGAGREPPGSPLPARHPRAPRFDAPLGPEWNHLRNPTRASYSLDARPGWLTLRGGARLARSRGLAHLGRPAAAAPVLPRGDARRLRARPRRRGGRDQRLHEPGPPLRDRRGPRGRAPAGVRAPAHRTARRDGHRLGADRRERARRPAGRGHARGVRLLLRDRRRAGGPGRRPRPSARAARATSRPRWPAASPACTSACTPPATASPCSAPAHFDWFDYEPR